MKIIPIIDINVDKILDTAAYSPKFSGEIKKANTIRSALIKKRDNIWVNPMGKLEIIRVLSSKSTPVSKNGFSLKRCVNINDTIATMLAMMK
nr:hypothetical protein [Methanospirillum hungatei]